MVKYSALRGMYEVERTIGCGGFAKVKLATHLATGEKVAIKIMEKALLKDDLPRVRLELKALRNLSHEHICKLYQVCFLFFPFNMFELFKLFPSGESNYFMFTYLISIILYVIHRL